MDAWRKLKALYTLDHLSKKLESPQTRLNALIRIETILRENVPDILSDPHLLLQIPKANFSYKLQEWKGSDLTSSEKSVITGLYKFIPQLMDSNAELEDIIHIEKKTSPVKESTTSEAEYDKKAFYKEMGELIVSILQERDFKEIDFKVSHRIESLHTSISKDVFPKTWHYLADTYTRINGFNLKLDEVIATHKPKSSRLQEADIFFVLPFSMMVEYDEDQHFNQFRLETLKSDMYSKWNGFNRELYTDLNSVIKKPGSKKSGFYYLKSPDPLFPENHKEDKQDNRLRQRAFRDMMKDAYCIEMGWKPVLRIPASLANGKRKGLNKNEWDNVRQYCNDILDKIL